MKTNNIDKNIKEKFLDRTFTPSASAWERLSNQLDEQPKQKKFGWFFYIGAAASLLLLVSISVQMFTNDKVEVNPLEEIVTTPIDTTVIDQKIDEFINEVPAKEAIVKNDIELKVANKKLQNMVAKKEQQPIKKIQEKSTKKELKSTTKPIETIAKIEEPKIEQEKIKVKPNRSIKVNADDLLYAVTHSSKEVKEHYAKHNITRDEILKTIKSELKKSNLKVNPNSILAEVERSIDDDDFQNNFLKSLKTKVSDIASAIATRND